jgi:hypothetical protein
MKTLLVVGMLSAGFIAQAQTPAITAHAPDGGTSFHIQSIDVPPLTGSPFSATVSTEWTRVLADGTSATVKNHRVVARDSSGRIFEERRYFSADGDLKPTPLSALEYSDPVRHEFVSCIPQQKTCYVSEYRRTALQAMPSGIGGLQACECASPHAPGYKVSEEALGQKSIEDVDATGSREITTLPAGQFGNEKAQPIVKEFWYSPRLGLNLVTRRFDPRSGAENFVVQPLSLNEPDPKMFEPPADYQVVRQVVVKERTLAAE